MYQVGDKVEFIKYPNLKGTIREILPAVDDLPETISVDMFIPADEPGFDYTGITENFWCGPEDLRANTGLQPTYSRARGVLKDRGIDPVEDVRKLRGG